MSFGLIEGSSYSYYYSSAWFGFDQAVDIVESTLRTGYSYSSYGRGDNGLNLSKSIDAGYGSPVMLSIFPQGCLIDGKNDCPTACADAARVWQGENWIYTLANCMVYPIISVAMGKDLLNYTESSEYATGGSSEYENNTALTVAKKYKIEGDADLDVESAWSTINKCTAAYCSADSPGSPCNLTNQTGFRTDWFVADNWYPTLHFNTSLCNGVDQSVNQDLGGVGMIIAYVLQLSILLSGLLIETVNSRGAGLLAFPYFAIVRRRKPFRDNWKTSKQLQHRIRYSSQAVALKVALVEFHKTQVFFILAVSIAALLAVSNAAYLQVSSWQQLWNNISFITTVALGGCYPVVLNLLVLRKTARLSFFVLSTSTCCVAVSMVLWIYTKAHQPNPGQIKFSVGYVLPECGTDEYFSPLQTCLQDGSDYIGGFNSHVQFLVFPVVALIFLVVEEVRIFKVVRADGKEKHINVYESFRRWIANVDATPAQHRARTVSVSSWNWVQKQTTTPMQSPLHRRIVAVKAWYKDKLWWTQDKVTQLAKRLPAVAVAGAATNHYVLTPAWTWTSKISKQGWTATRTYGFRKTCLWTLNALYKLLPFLTELGMVVITLILFAQYANYLGIFTDNSWSLGQVISVTIWVPVVVEYIYLLFCGIEEGFEYRLSTPYHVMKRDGEEMNEESDAGEGSTEGGKASQRSSMELEALRDSTSTPAPGYTSIPPSVRKASTATTSLTPEDKDPTAESPHAFLPSRRSWQTPYTGT